ncbi:MAG: carbamoyl-phosphate synthase large subunit [Acidobacteriota bacterium]|jgi:carbamoyl-phosphate synthase large subunit|nr:carbamoyl-phosphate synthase large subunit [Acidobacteriota bacterium]
MPKRTDLKKILIIGSGPIVIGQACEFDYSGTQACKSLQQEGYEVVLVNSNPATIMTDPDLADQTYVEPLTAESVAAIIERERPNALLPTVGGQTGLNVSVELARSGVLDKFGVEMIGAKLQAVEVAEDRQLFKDAMTEIGLNSAHSRVVRSMAEAMDYLGENGLPAIIRPSFTLGGSGGGTAFNREEYEEIITRGLDISPVHEVLVEQSLIGWKEYELEVMRDLADNVVIICSIENFDPMGVHTGDSITVAPAQTLTDKEYQIMRNAALRIIRKVGVETGGSNIQFALNPDNGDLVVIEMNPRVSRSSALASKATGFPIAKIAAKLAVGYTLDEIPNDITKKTPASFEPTIDYVVAKIPKWNFEKFKAADPTLGTQMKSVGEVMAIGRTFKEALLKGVRSLEKGKSLASEKIIPANLDKALVIPTPDRLAYIHYALASGERTVEEVHQRTKIDRWFLQQLQEIIDLEKRLARHTLATLPDDLLLECKRSGFSDQNVAEFLKPGDGDGAKPTAEAVMALRHAKGVRPVYKRVDTCAAEFESFTPYLYSTYETCCEAAPSDKKKIMILGSGPNRIGQGLEFDYCCCHAAFALKEAGYETIMVNCNPETVSTDYDTSDRLYFEPLTFEDVMEIVAVEKPGGVIVQFGGQTPLNLAVRLQAAGVPIIGTSPDNIDLAEDRKRFGQLLDDLGIPSPTNGTAMSQEEARAVAARIGYPVLVRPSYVLGGRAMSIVYDQESLDNYMTTAVEASPEHPVLVDKFLEDAFEYDVDTICDGEQVIIAGVMEHIEEAGIHSGDSTCVLPPIMIDPSLLDLMKRYTRQLGRALGVIGIMNIQFAVQNGVVYVLEVNPRASRTVPYVSKSTGVPLAKMAARVMAGEKLKDLGITADLKVGHYFVKSPVFPFNKFQGVDTILGPEMRSTGEVMGVAESFGIAFAKAQLSAGVKLPQSGRIFLSVNDSDKGTLVSIARELAAHGLELLATSGTRDYLKKEGIEATLVLKAGEGRPNVVDLIKSKKIDLIINTPLGSQSYIDDQMIRSAAIQHGVPCITTLSGASAAAKAIGAIKAEKFTVRSLQEYHLVE